MAKKIDKPKTLFDHIRQITATQNPDYWSTLTDTDKKSWSTYMIMRFLSMQPEWITTVNELQPFVERLDPPIVYELLIGIIPKSRVFLKYVKPDFKTPKYEPWLVDLVKKEFECKTERAISYINILRSLENGVDTLYSICTKYGTDPKIVEKLKL